MEEVRDFTKEVERLKSYQKLAETTHDMAVKYIRIEEDNPLTMAGAYIGELFKPLCSIKIQNNWISSFQYNVYYTQTTIKDEGNTKIIAIFDTSIGCMKDLFYVEITKDNYKVCVNKNNLTPYYLNHFCADWQNIKSALIKMIDRLIQSQQQKNKTIVEDTLSYMNNIKNFKL